MARLARSEKLHKDEHGAFMPLRAQRPAFALSLMERMDDIDVEIAGDVITISGKKEDEEVEKKDYFRFERLAGAFCRSVALPAEVQLDSATAQLRDGVLEIGAPKVVGAKATSRKIEVT